MRSAEEIKEWAENFKYEGMSLDEVNFVENLLRFIESEPPCMHYAGVGNCHTGFGWMPFRIQVGQILTSTEAEFARFKFCPDCGTELEKLTA